jgi:hypothetical protein
VAVGDWSTGRATVSIDPEPSGRQSGDLGEKWRQFGLRNIFIHARRARIKMGPTALLPLRRKWCSGFLSPLKIQSKRIEPANIGPSGEHANH